MRIEHPDSVKGTIRMLLIFSVFPSIMVGQYAYFNSYFLPPDYLNQNSGHFSNSIIRGDSIIVFGDYYAYSDVVNNLKILDGNGNILSNYEEVLPDGTFNYINYDESMNLAEDGDLIWGNGVSDALALHATCVRFNSDYSREWTRSLEWNLSDTTFNEFHCAKEISNGEIMAAGVVIYDLEPDPGQDYCRLLLGKYSAEGDSIWEKEIPFWDEEVAGSKEFLRINGIFEQPNGDFLLSGAWYHDWDPFFLRLSSESEFIGQFTWGSERNDGLPWCVPTDDGKLMFAYSNCTEYALDNEYLAINDARIGLFDPELMDTLWTRSYGYSKLNFTVNNFERTNDGGFVALVNMPGQGDSLDWYVGAGAYLLKVDEAGNDEFIKHIPVPAEFTADGWSVESWGLEIASDGGYTGVGNFIPEGENYWVAWIWKTDCMGNLEAPDLAFNAAITQLSDSTFLCEVDNDNLQNYTWDMGDGSEVLTGDSIVYQYTQSGEFDITLSGTYCYTALDTVLSVVATVGIDEPKVAFMPRFWISPNPCGDVLNVRSEEIIDRIYLWDVSGRLILQQSINSKRSQIDVFALSSGIYQINVYFGIGKTRSYLVVIE